MSPASAELERARRRITDLERKLAAIGRELGLADAMLAAHAGTLDPHPREQWLEGSVLERAIARHEAREAREARQ